MKMEHLEKKIAFLLQLWLCGNFKVLRIGQNDFFYKIKWSEKLILALEPRNKKKVLIYLLISAGPRSIILETA